jgi:hypothetical protein
MYVLPGVWVMVGECRNERGSAMVEMTLPRTFEGGLMIRRELPVLED